MNSEHLELINTKRVAKARAGEIRHANTPDYPTPPCPVHLSTCIFGPPLAYSAVVFESNMALNPTVAVAIFGLYIAVILILFGVVGYSIIPKTDKTRLFEQKPFLFLRCALGALLSTWYCKLEGRGYLTQADE